MSAQVPTYENADGNELPEGWVRWVDPDSDEFYYHNALTGETTWDDPSRWRIGLLVDRIRGLGPSDAAPAKPYRPRTVEAAFAEWSTKNAALDDDDGAGSDESDDDDDDDVRSRPRPPPAGPEQPVTLRVYDVAFKGARALNSVLGGSSGAFHTAIEVHGLEWSFGAILGDEDACGIFACEPATAQPHQYREAISLGRTRRTPVDVFNLLLRTAPMWKGASYDVLRKNCNSFCIVLAGELGADPPPPWTHRLGDGAAALEDRARRLAASLEQGPEIDGSAGPAAVVWDDHGDWHAAHFDTLDEAEPTWASLPLTHAACVFVRVNSPRVADAGGGAVVRVPDEGDSPAAAWRVAKTYGLPHATKRIQERFGTSRALRRRGAPSTHTAPQLLRPGRRPIPATPLDDGETTFL